MMRDLLLALALVLSIGNSIALWFITSAVNHLVEASQAINKALRTLGPPP